MRKLILGITAIVCLDAVFVALTYLSNDVDLTVKAIATNAEKNLEVYWMNELEMDSFIPPVPENRTWRSTRKFRRPLRPIEKADKPKGLQTIQLANLFPTRVIYIPATDRSVPYEPSRIRIVKNGDSIVIFYPGPPRSSEKGKNPQPAKKITYVARLIPYPKTADTP